MFVCSESFPESVVNDDCCGCGDCDDEVAEDDCEEDEAAPADVASRLPTWGLRPMPLSAPPPAAEDVSGSGENTGCPLSETLCLHTFCGRSLERKLYSLF